MPRSRRFFSALNKRERLLPYLLVAPALAVLLALSIYPLIYSITISLQHETAAGTVWSLVHFKRLVTDSFFHTALVHTFVYAAVALMCEFVLGLLIKRTSTRGILYPDSGAPLARRCKLHAPHSRFSLK